MASTTDQRLKLYDRLRKEQLSLSQYDANRDRIIKTFGEYAFLEQRKAYVRDVRKAENKLAAFNAANPIQPRA